MKQHEEGQRVGLTFRKFGISTFLYLRGRNAHNIFITTSFLQFKQEITNLCILDWFWTLKYWTILIYNVLIGEEFTKFRIPSFF
jgi:hypothetical protein